MPLKRKVDLYNVLDEDGNVIKQLRYPHGSPVAEEAKKAADEGVYEVYEGEKFGDEIYAPASSAKVNIDIDPVAGKVKVSGPKWLTDEVIASDTFKQNVSENATLKNLLSTYRTSPTAKITMKDGTSMPVYQVLGDFSNELNDQFSNYASVTMMRDQIEAKYGTKLSDKQVAIANSALSKDDVNYNGSNAVYIPEWAKEMYDWKSLASFNEEEWTVSAKDFFGKAYKMLTLEGGGGEERTQQFRDYAKAWMEDAIAKNSYDRSDKETSEIRKKSLSDGKYAEELARSKAFYKWVTGNEPEKDPLMTAKYFGLGFAGELTKDIANAGFNMNTGMMQLLETINFNWTPNNRDESIVLFATNPYYRWTVALGYASLAIESGDISKVGESFNDMFNTWATSEDKNLSDAFTELKKEYDEGLRGYGLEPGVTDLKDFGGDAAKVGAFFGHMAYKVIENVVVLNSAGELAEGIATGAKLAPVVSKFAPEFAKGIATFSKGSSAKAIGFAVNTGVQGLLETLIDDKEIVDAAFESGELTPDLMSKIGENWMWNAVGEFSPVVGRDLKKAIVSTTPGKALDMALTKVAAGIGYIDSKVNKKMFEFLNYLKRDNAGALSAKGGKGVEKYSIEFYEAKAKAEKAIMDMPVLREMTEEEKQIFKDSSAYILTGKTAKEVGEMSDEEVKKLFKTMYENADELPGGVKQNYQYFQKAIINRMNLEDNFDAILRGEQNKINEMNAFAGKNADSYNESLRKTLQMEQDAIKNGAELTARETGSFMTKESAEYLSYSTQRGRYEYLVNSGKLTGKALENAKSYLTFVDKQLDALKGTLGDALAKQLDSHLVTSGKYYASILDYMVKRGYMTKEAADLISRLRNNVGWGKNGESYIPTARLFGKNEFEVDIETFTKEIEPGKMLKGETLPAEMKKYQVGDEADSFMDPTMVMYAHVRQMAKAAQGQDMWRALRATNVLSRSIKGFDSNGLSQFDVNLIQKGSKSLQKDFNELFNAKGKDIARAIKSTFGESRAMEMGFSSAAAAKSLEEAGTTYRTTLINTSSVADVETMLSFAPEKVVVPNLDTTGVTDAAFDGWFRALPKDAQTTIVSRLGGQELNIKNVNNLFTSNPEVKVDINKQWLASKDADALWKTKEAKKFLIGRAEADATAAGNILLKEDADNYLKASTEAKQKGIKMGGQKAYRSAFATQIKRSADTIINEMTSSIGNSASKGTLDNMAESIVKATDGRIEADVAKRYVVLLQLNNLSEANIKSALRKNYGELAKISKDLGVSSGKGIRNDALDYVSKAIKTQMESELNALQNTLKSAGAGDAMDLETYWKSVKGYQDDIMKQGGEWFKNGANDIERRIVRAVDGNGELRYYETDPSTAFLVNRRPVYEKSGRLATLHQNLNQLFRMGTTGIDRISYINQWFRDPLNATTVGAALPFTDLGVNSVGKAMASDYVPFGQRIFGKNVTERMSKEVVDSTYEATRAGLAADYGEEFVADLEKSAAKGLEGEGAQEASRRAVVEYGIQSSGYETLPSSGIREAESYRVTAGKGTGKGGTEKTMQEVRQGEFDEILNSKSASRINKGAQKAQRRYDNFMSEHLSRGQWRETFLRKSVYTSQYKNAIESGMTAPEAKIWASRYAMDATTNFGRPLAAFNKFFRQVPYFSAAINGTKSFYRLLELDPLGVSTRFITGMAMPYTAVLAQSLSDPTNLEAYKNVPEYEKADNFVFFYEGAKISIPVPQELSAFLSPFRHVVEKSAGANDKSWIDLAASDALGMFPVDLSGFMELDPKTYLNDPSWGDRIGRGCEKALSSLMSPAVKSTYMLAFKRDPYTGKEITDSYPVFTDDGELVMMDSDQSEIAHLLAGKGLYKDIPASGVHKILNALMGRSTISVLDGAVELFSGQAVEDGEWEKQGLMEWVAGRAGDATSQLLKPISVGETTYNQVNRRWQNTINELYDARDELTTNDKFTKAYRTLQSQSAGEKEKEGAMQVYRTMLDEYQAKVLKMAQNLQREHPEAYTSTREAQIISLLSLPTGLTYNQTAYAQDMRNEAYYDANAAAISSYVKMGFPQDKTVDTILGRGYYDSYGHYQFKIYTPYEIQYLKGGIYGTDDEIKAQINQALKANDISSGDMWKAYYSTNDKAERKQIMEDWNKKAVPVLAPIVHKYGLEYMLNDSQAYNALSNNIFTTNKYKKKEYIREVFGGSN